MHIYKRFAMHGSCLWIDGARKEKPMHGIFKSFHAQSALQAYAFGESIGQVNIRRYGKAAIYREAIYDLAGRSVYTGANTDG